MPKIREICQRTIYETAEQLETMADVLCAYGESGAFARLARKDTFLIESRLRGIGEILRMLADKTERAAGLLDVGRNPEELETEMDDVNPNGARAFDQVARVTEYWAEQRRKKSASG